MKTFKMMPRFGFFYTRFPAWCPVLALVALCGIGAPQAARGQMHLAGGTAWGRGGTGLAAEVGMRRPVGQGGRVALGAAITAGDAGAHFGAAEARVEFRIDPAAAFAPFVALGAGVLSEPEALRAVWSLSLGLAPRIGAGRRLRLAGAWSRSDGAAGPYRVLMGVEFTAR
ncbi:MAG: hypothetical protein KJO11_16670 [Gemmatimonadetes bacterium]|nr:hypothetical protein [Gemmatimonadota bacterium]